uniref:Putative secreted protein n=1 Tax=Ixodes ricinus TaxID=34613 RepID=A0A6B0UPS2_IXORI
MSVRPSVRPPVRPSVWRPVLVLLLVSSRAHVLPCILQRPKFSVVEGRVVFRVFYGHFSRPVKIRRPFLVLRPGLNRGDKCKQQCVLGTHCQRVLSTFTSVSRSTEHCLSGKRSAHFFFLLLLF